MRAVVHGGQIPGALLLALAVAVGVIQVRRQRVQAVPLLPLDLLRPSVFARSVGTSVTAFAAPMLSYIALPFLLL